MQDISINPIEYFRIKSRESGSKVSIGNMTRAVESFSRFIDGTDFTFSGFDEVILGEWASRQLFDGYSAKTVAYNLSKIAALYNKAVAEGFAAPVDSFSCVLAKIKELPDVSFCYDHAATFPGIRNIFLNDYSRSFEKQLARDIIVFGILAGGLTLSEIAEFRKDCYSGGNTHIRSIIQRYSKPKNKYLFPLRRSRTTLKKTTEAIYTLITGLLEQNGVKTGCKTIDFLLTDLWADIAMETGISASEIKTCISATGHHNLLAHCAVSSQLEEETIIELRDRVSDAIVNNPVRWYALHLRKHVEFEDFTSRLSERGITLEEVYYPMEDIVRKVGRKKIFGSRPVISWLVFYRTKATGLNALFREIGDIAWGYRYVRDVRSPYAVIADSEVARYQLAIGTLGSSTELSTGADTEIKEGDTVVILGGPMVGHQGKFLSEKKDTVNPSGRTLYRITLQGGSSISWEVNLDSRLVKKL